MKHPARLADVDAEFARASRAIDATGHRVVRHDVIGPPLPDTSAASDRRSARSRFRPFGGTSGVAKTQQATEEARRLASRPG
jgi:hypothetical protein